MASSPLSTEEGLSKLNMDRLFSLRRDARSAPRGTGLQLFGTHETVTRFPFGTPLQPGTSIPPFGSRCLHESRALHNSAKVVANRPLSPNLIQKKPQLRATYSISHRIFGVGVGALILLCPLAMKYSTLFDV